MSEKDPGTILVPVKTQWLFTIVIFVLGNLIGGFGTKTVVDNGVQAQTETKVYEQIDTIIKKINFINDQNRHYVLQVENRINTRLDSVIFILQEKAQINEKAIINLDGYFKGYVENSNNGK